MCRYIHTRLRERNFESIRRGGTVDLTRLYRIIIEEENILYVYTRKYNVEIIFNNNNEHRYTIWIIL